MLSCSVEARFCTSFRTCSQERRPSAGAKMDGSHPGLVVGEMDTYDCIHPDARLVINSQGTSQNARNSSFLSSNGCLPNSWTRTMATKTTSFPALFHRTSSLFEGHRIVVFFNSFELLFFSLSYLLASRNGSVFLLGPCQNFVVQFLAFSFRFGKVGSLI